MSDQLAGHCFRIAGFALLFNQAGVLITLAVLLLLIGSDIAATERRAIGGQDG